MLNCDLSKELLSEAEYIFQFFSSDPGIDPDGRATVISRISMPQGRPTYRLHILRPSACISASYSSNYLLIMNEHAPECGLSYRDFASGHPLVAHLFTEVKMEPKVGTQPSCHAFAHGQLTSNLQYFQCTAYHCKANLWHPLCMQPLQRSKLPALGRLRHSDCPFQCLVAPSLVLRRTLLRALALPKHSLDRASHL